MPKKLPSDSTIATVWPHLKHPKAYVSGALHKARQCNSENGNASIRIGVTGTGQRPYYRVFYNDTQGNEIIFGSFFDNHDPFDIQDAITYNWSTASMPFQDVLEFYADKIGFKGELK